MRRAAMSVVGFMLTVPVVIVTDLSDPAPAYATCLDVDQGNLIRWDPDGGFIEEKNFERATCNDNGYYQLLYRGTTRYPEDKMYVRYYRNGAWIRTPYTNEGNWIYATMDDANHFAPARLCITYNICRDGDFTHRKF